jgi:hypothetical protein
MMQTEPLSMTQSAIGRIRSFRQRFGDGHLYLACHAALPLALTPDLLYRLWATFQRDCQDDDLAMPWVSVSDLLLSGLCDEVGDELYEMDSTVRDALIQQLKDSPRLGLVRVRELAEFVIAYIDPQLNSADLDTRDFAQAQHWRALAYKNPREAVQSIATTLAELSFDDTHEWIRMAALVETLAEPLVEFPELLVYVRAIDDFARGNDRSAMDKLKQISDGNQQIKIADVDLPIPGAIKKEDSKNKPISSERKTSLIDLIRQYSHWLIGGSVLATMTFGGVILYNSRIPQPYAEYYASPTPSPQSNSSFSSSRPYERPATPNARYVVVIPKENGDTLSRVRQFVGSAQAYSSNKGDYIAAGTFSDRAQAEKRSNSLQSYGLKAQVNVEMPPLPQTTEEKRTIDQIRQ